MGPIYSYLGADEASLPLLLAAGPVTGLLVQLIIGALSDRTVTRIDGAPLFPHRRSALQPVSFAMPCQSGRSGSRPACSGSLTRPTTSPWSLIAFGVSDRLTTRSGRSVSLTQSAFTGLAQTLSYLAPSLLVWVDQRRCTDLGHPRHHPHRLHRWSGVVAFHHIVVGTACPRTPFAG